MISNGDKDGHYVRRTSPVQEALNGGNTLLTIRMRQWNLVIKALNEQREDLFNKILYTCCQRRLNRNFKWAKGGLS